MTSDKDAYSPECSYIFFLLDLFSVIGFKSLNVQQLVDMD